MSEFNKIIQFGTIRSGSTLIFNMLKILFKEKNIYKSHNIEYNNEDLFVITIRHPYNCIISSILRFNQEINIENLQKHTDIFFDRNGGGWDMMVLDINKPNIIIVFYEDLIDNIDNTIDMLGLKLGLNINDEIRNKIKINTDIEKMNKISTDLKEFVKWDINTFIHGNHISKFKGKTDYKQILNEEQLNYLKSYKMLNDFIEKFNYTK